MDTVGAFGRTVADAVLGLNTIVGEDSSDAATTLRDRRQEDDYAKFLSSKSSLKGAKFGLPQNRCWDLVPSDRKHIALQVFKAIEELGGEVINTDFPCAEDRIADDGSWDW